MSDVDERQRVERDEPVVERGRTYEHADHGRVEVTGIWEEIHRLDAVRETETTGVIIVRYAPVADERSADEDEYTETLRDFLAATE